MEAAPDAIARSHLGGHRAGKAIENRTGGHAPALEEEAAPEAMALESLLRGRGLGAQTFEPDRDTQIQSRQICTSDGQPQATTDIHLINDLCTCIHLTSASCNSLDQC